MDGPESGGDIGRGQRVAERGDLCARARPRRCHVTPVTAVTRTFAVTASDPHTWRHPARPRPRPRSPILPPSDDSQPSALVRHARHAPRFPPSPAAVAQSRPPHRTRIARSFSSSALPSSLLHPHHPSSTYAFYTSCTLRHPSSAVQIRARDAIAGFHAIHPSSRLIATRTSLPSRTFSPFLFLSPRAQRRPPRSPLAPHRLPASLRPIAPVRRVPVTDTQIAYRGASSS